MSSQLILTKRENFGSGQCRDKHIYKIYIYKYLIYFESHLIVLNEFWAHSFLRLAEHEVNCVGCETQHFAWIQIHLLRMQRIRGMHETINTQIYAFKNCINSKTCFADMLSGFSRLECIFKYTLFPLYYLSAVIPISIRLHFEYTSLIKLSKSTAHFNSSIPFLTHSINFLELLYRKDEWLLEPKLFIWSSSKKISDDEVFKWLQPHFGQS